MIRFALMLPERLLGVSKVTNSNSYGNEQLQIQDLPCGICQGIRADLLPDDGMRDESAQGYGVADWSGVESKND